MLHYDRLKTLIGCIDEPNRQICFKLLEDHANRFRQAAGSSHNHQAWEGGLWNHILETMNIYRGLYDMFEERILCMPADEQPTLSDGLLVMFLHDIEKLWAYKLIDGKLVFDGNLKPVSAGLWSSKEERRGFANGVIAAYGFELSREAQNALKYVEGIRDADYTPHERLMGRLAALCHSADVISARTCHDFPLPDGEDPWEGALQGVPT